MTVTPKELLEASERLLRDIHEQVSPDYNDSPDRVIVCDHILATVRADDDEPITDAKLMALGGVRCTFPDDIAFGPLVRGIIRNVQSPANGQWYWVIRSYPIPAESEPRTMGQFRTLCRVLGITLPEVPA